MSGVKWSIDAGEHEGRQYTGYQGNVLGFIQARCRQIGSAGGKCENECTANPNGCPRDRLKNAMQRAAAKNHPDDIRFESDGKVKMAQRHGGVFKRDQLIMQDVGNSGPYCYMPGVSGAVAAEVIDNFITGNPNDSYSYTGY